MPRLPVIIGVVAICLGNATALSQSDHPHSPRCRYLPGDAHWPNTHGWQQLNTSISGRLIKTIPLGSACHDPTYKMEACAALAKVWDLPQTHFVHPSSFMSAYHQNASCNPFTPENSTCLLGNTVSYAINVTSASDAIAGVKFAQEKNVRLVIKNTGHDYLGKSTGKGALSLWMHNLKSISFHNHTSPAYSGPAIRIGAGVQAFEAYTAAAARGLRVVGGECITVGLAGGFTQGGGHSLLSSKYGLGADQALEWEVIIANGTHLIASPTKNSDLYWALSGGGGGTYGVVLSLTVKAYQDGIVGGASMAISFLSTDDERMWDTVSFFQAEALPKIVDAGAHVQWGISGPMIFVSEVTIPDIGSEEMRDVMQPFVTYLMEKKVTFQLNVTTFPSYLEHIEHYLGPLPYGAVPIAQIQGGILVSRETVKKNVTELTAALRHITTKTGFYSAPYSFNVNRKPSSPNAVLPAWREALTMYPVIHTWNFTVPFAEMDEQERLLTDELMPPLQELASGAYMNEADSRNPRWKEEFYGENWDILRSVKRKWDSKDLFYATTAVGSDVWMFEQDGRLCRA